MIIFVAMLMPSVGSNEFAFAAATAASARSASCTHGVVPNAESAPPPFSARTEASGSHQGRLMPKRAEGLSPMCHVIRWRLASLYE